jgi:hypothetical protein
MRFIFYKVSHVLFQIYLILLTRKESIFLYIKKKKQNIKEFCLQLLNKAKKTNSSNLKTAWLLTSLL